MAPRWSLLGGSTIIWQPLYSFANLASEPFWLLSCGQREKRTIMITSELVLQSTNTVKYMCFSTLFVLYSVELDKIRHKVW